MRRQCPLDGAATGQQSENSGFRGLLGPAGDFACPRNQYILFSHGSVRVIDCHIPVVVRWGTQATAAVSLGNLLEMQSWGPPPLLAETRGGGRAQRSAPEPAARWLTCEGHCSGPARASQLSTSTSLSAKRESSRRSYRQDTKHVLSFLTNSSSSQR